MKQHTIEICGKPCTIYLPTINVPAANRHNDIDSAAILDQIAFLEQDYGFDCHIYGNMSPAHMCNWAAVLLTGGFCDD